MISKYRELFDDLLDLEVEILVEMNQCLTSYLSEETKYGFIYLMRYSTGCHAIGFSKDPLITLNRLSTDEILPTEIELLHSIETDDMLRLQEYFQEVLGQKWVGETLYMLEQEDVEFFKTVKHVWYDRHSLNIKEKNGN